MERITGYKVGNSIYHTEEDALKAEKNACFSEKFSILEGNFNGYVGTHYLRLWVEKHREELKEFLVIELRPEPVEEAPEICHVRDDPYDACQ